MSDAAIAACSERIRALEVTVNRMDSHLFGNGQPGELELLNNRVSKMERIVWAVGGVLGFLTMLMHGAEAVRGLLK